MLNANIDQAMTNAIRNIMRFGDLSSPRAKPVKELVGQAYAFDMRYPIVTKPSRNIGYRFYAAEAYWILSGRNDLEFFRELNMPFIWEFSDDGFFYSGAYGPRVVDQITYVCDVLAGDPHTRQAVIEVWRPNPRPSRDIPCTLSFQFIARGGKLHCVQSMRSSDVWLGYPYDAFNAAMLTTYVVLLLQARNPKAFKTLDVGTHTIVVGSQHLYQPQWELAKAVLADTTELWYEPLSASRFASPADLLSYLSACAAHPNGVDPRIGGRETPWSRP